MVVYVELKYSMAMITGNTLDCSGYISPGYDKTFRKFILLLLWLKYFELNQLKTLRIPFLKIF